MKLETRFELWLNHILHVYLTFVRELLGAPISLSKIWSKFLQGSYVNQRKYLVSALNRSGT